MYVLWWQHRVHISRLELTLCLTTHISYDKVPVKELLHTYNSLDRVCTSLSVMPCQVIGASANVYISRKQALYTAPSSPYLHTPVPTYIYIYIQTPTNLLHSVCTAHDPYPVCTLVPCRGGTRSVKRRRAVSVSSGTSKPRLFVS